jgi:hypothetical protein
MSKILGDQAKHVDKEVQKMLSKSNRKDMDGVANNTYPLIGSAYEAVQNLLNSNKQWQSFRTSGQILRIFDIGVSRVYWVAQQHKQVLEQFPERFFLDHKETYVRPKNVMVGAGYKAAAALRKSSRKSSNGDANNTNATHTLLARSSQPNNVVETDNIMSEEIPFKGMSIERISAQIKEVKKQCQKVNKERQKYKHKCKKWMSEFEKKNGRKPRKGDTTALYHKLRTALATKSNKFEQLSTKLKALREAYSQMTSPGEDAIQTKGDTIEKNDDKKNTDVPSDELSFTRTTTATLKVTNQSKE